MKYLLSIVLIILLLTLQGAKADQPQLLFSSGFEKGARLGPLVDGYQKITGTDLKTGFSWPIRILGASNSALHLIEHDNQKAVRNEIQTVWIAPA